MKNSPLEDVSDKLRNAKDKTKDDIYSKCGVH